MDYGLVFKIIGAVGLLLMAVGVMNKNRETQDWLYIIGGVCLEAYSIYLQDPIFIILQIVFTIAAVYDLIQVRRKLVVGSE